jgi:hypothetical protein
MMERGKSTIEKRTELASLHLLADRETADAFHRGEPISETINMMKAIASARDAVASYRRSTESLSDIAEPTVRLSILQLAEELTKLIIEAEQNVSAPELTYAR